MKIGDKYEDGGRVLVVDGLLNNGKYLTHVLGKVGEVEPIEEMAEPTEIPITTEEPVKEPVEKVELEPVKTETEEPVFKCQYCGRAIKSKVGLASHEKACKENPANK